MPNVIVNSCYIKDSSHFINYLTYAGEKLEAQTLLLKDGTRISASPDEQIDVSAHPDLAYVQLQTKDGSFRTLTPLRYQKRVEEKTDGVSEQTVVLENGTEQNLDAFVEEQKKQKKLHELDPAIYLNYIAHRPGVEWNDNVPHGLFDLNGTADMEQVRQDVLTYEKSIKWSHVISLTREDAQRTGFDNRQAWQNLIQAKAYDIARIYNISPENLVINAAYHDKSYHPHCHLFLYSKDAREGQFRPGALPKKTEKMKSLFHNAIFAEDVAVLKERKQTYRQDLRAELDRLVKEIGKKGYRLQPEIETAFADLSDALIDYSGRPYYQYLPHTTKLKVQEVLYRSVTQDKNLAAIFEKLCDNQRDFITKYADDAKKIAHRVEQFKIHFFNPTEKNDSRALHNLILKNAMLYNQQRTGGAPVVRKEETAVRFPNAPETAESFPDAPGEAGTDVVRKKEHLPTGHIKAIKSYRSAKKLLEEEKIPQAIQAFQEAAAADYDVAQYQLGKLYLVGKDVPKDIPKALSYLEASAAERLSGDNERLPGNQYAQYTLGMLYYKGEDVKKDKKTAAFYFQQAADQNNPFAKTMLSVIQYQKIAPVYAAAHMLAQLSRSMSQQAALQQAGQQSRSQNQAKNKKKAPRFQKRKQHKKNITQHQSYGY